MSLTQNYYGLSFFDYKGGKNRMSTSVYHLEDQFPDSIGQGDPVTVGLGGTIYAYVPENAAPSPAGAPALADTAILGQAVSFEWISATGVSMRNQPYWPAGTKTLNGVGAFVTVADLPYNVYRIQANGALGTNTAPHLFWNYNLSNCETTSLPNPATSQSTAFLDVGTTVASTNYWLSVKIVGLAPATLVGGPNNWSDPYPEVLVLINNHAYKPGTNGANQ